VQYRNRFIGKEACREAVVAEIRVVLIGVRAHLLFI